tara:strand:- start:18022 stop:21903 length:3882 start_codon:yes stop_codon:yes gene_type:complete
MVLSIPNNSNESSLKNFGIIDESNFDAPDLVHIQKESYDWLLDEGIRELFKEISPINDSSGDRFEVRFIDHEIREPIRSEEECRKEEITYSAPLYVTVELKIISSGEVKQQVLFMGDIPKMTKYGTFIINGAERVIVSQLVRSPGAYFQSNPDPASGRTLCDAKLIPYRGAWIEIETSNRNLITVKIDRKRKSPVTTFLRCIGIETDEEILNIFKDVDTSDYQFIKTTLERDSAVKTRDEALIEFYKRIRPGEPPNLNNADKLVEELFFNERKYDLGRVGRYKLNKKLNSDAPLSEKIITRQDLVATMKHLIRINNNEISADDIDHLGNRRVRGVGELIQNQIRVGLLRMERVIKERMTTQMDPEVTTPAALVNIRPIVASLREFFGGSQLSQFMDQTNPLSELTHKRRLSALGPGGLSRERAGFDVRDVHHSHYGRICPIETPEGPNIGLLGSLAVYGKTNNYGFIETPYRRVFNYIGSNDVDIVSRIVTEDVKNGKKIMIKKGQIVKKEDFEKIKSLEPFNINVIPYITSKPQDVEFMSADEEEDKVIGQSTTQIDQKGQIISDTVDVREGEDVKKISPENLSHLDVSPLQIVSVSTSLIPFLEHDDANRALMGSNMQRQAVPLLLPESPLVGTGMEQRVAQESGQVIVSSHNGIVYSSTSTEIQIIDDSDEIHTYDLRRFVRSNQGTCINHIPIVSKGQKIIIGQPLADSSSTDGGELALGQNLTVAFMSWGGYNYEDAIILNQNLVKDDKFTSVHIEKFEVEARETKLGDEDITRDIPNVGEDTLLNLDEDGIIQVGASVKPGDILVGKITPKGETELTSEEKLLRAIFGEKARDVKDSSLRVPHGQYGKVINVRRISRKDLKPRRKGGITLSAGVQDLVRVWIAEKRKVTEGDKLAGRHGNKGVISKILHQEDMPCLPDGTPVDIILNPIGVPSRMNLGQILETHLGRAADLLGFKARTPVFSGADAVTVEDMLARAWFVSESNAFNKVDLDDESIEWDKVNKWIKDNGFKPDKVFSDGSSNKGYASKACLSIWLKNEAGVDISKIKESELMQCALDVQINDGLSAPLFGKTKLRDGKTGEYFDQPVTVGNMYILKLIHLVEDKIHARSTGPYSLITQQPLGGKAQFGGQRFGEMEVWALEAYSAAHTLQEMLTVKSDDVIGRVKTYEAIVKGEPVTQPGIPESFQVLLKELQGLGLSIELISENSVSGNLGQEDQDTIGDDFDNYELPDELTTDIAFPEPKEDTLEDLTKQLIDNPENSDVEIPEESSESLDVLVSEELDDSEKEKE